MASFCAVLYPTLVVLDEIWDLIASVSEGFHTYSFMKCILVVCFRIDKLWKSMLIKTSSQQRSIQRMMPIVEFISLRI